MGDNGQKSVKKYRKSTKISKKVHKNTENTRKFVRIYEDDPRDCAYNSNLSHRSRQNRLIFCTDYDFTGLERE